MSTFFGFLFLLGFLGGFVFILLGLFIPKKVAPFLKNPTRPNVFLVGCGIIIVSTIGVGLTAPNDTSEGNEADDVNFVTVDEKVYDAPIKTQVTQRLLADSDTLNPGVVEAALLKRYSSISERTGFDHHDNPTSVYIFVYAHPADTLDGGAHWARLEKAHADNSPEVVVKNSRSWRGDERWGMSYEDRRKLYRRMSDASVQAAEQAQERYPNDINRQVSYEQELRERIQGSILEELGVSSETWDSVALEQAELML